MRRTGASERGLPHTTRACVIALPCETTGGAVLRPLEPNRSGYTSRLSFTWPNPSARCQCHENGRGSLALSASARHPKRGNARATYVGVRRRTEGPVMERLTDLPYPETEFALVAAFKTKRAVRFVGP